MPPDRTPHCNQIGIPNIAPASDCLHPGIVDGLPRSTSNRTPSSSCPRAPRLILLVLLDSKTEAKQYVASPNSLVTRWASYFNSFQHRRHSVCTWRAIALVRDSRRAEDLNRVFLHSQHPLATALNTWRPLAGQSTNSCHNGVHFGGCSGMLCPSVVISSVQHKHTQTLGAARDFATVPCRLLGALLSCPGRSKSTPAAATATALRSAILGLKLKAAATGRGRAKLQERRGFRWPGA